MERSAYIIYNPLKAKYFQTLEDHSFQDWMVSKGLITRRQFEIDTGLKYLQQGHLTPQMITLAELLLSEDNRGFLVPSPKAIQAIWGESFKFVNVNTDCHWKIDSVNNRYFKDHMAKLRTIATSVKKITEVAPFRFHACGVSAGVDNFYLAPRGVYTLYRLYSKLNEGTSVDAEQLLTPLYQDTTEANRDLTLEAQQYIYYLRRDIKGVSSDIQILKDSAGYRLAV